MEPVRDIAVEVDRDRSAQLESWLLGHGRLPELSSDPPEGRLRYVVKRATRFEIDELRGLGRIVTRNEG